ncbi:hypothetical protein ACC731_38470, partial [Rhizobium ruizarguesonis]
IGIDVRNVSVTRGVGDYSAQQAVLLKTLQQQLAHLGCKPGNVEVKPDKATRQAALSCSVVRLSAWGSEPLSNLRQES